MVRRTKQNEQGHRSSLRNWGVLVSLAAVVMFSGWATATAFQGSEILARVDSAMHSDTRSMNQTMTVFSASGQSRSRELQVTSDSTGAEDKMLVRFTAPADVRGTGLLMDGDDMYLYMPALGRVRRIAGHAKQGSFMGSDFSYVDMEQFGSRGFSSDFEAEYLRVESFGEREAYALQLTPTTDSEYSQLLMWVDTALNLPLQIQYFEIDGTHVKTLTTRDFAQFGERWTATTMVMENVQSGSRTEMIVASVEFDQELESSLFTTRNLERGQ